MDFVPLIYSERRFLPTAEAVGSLGGLFVDRIDRRLETDLNILFDIFQDGIRASPIEKDRFDAASGEKCLNARVPVPKKNF